MLIGYRSGFSTDEELGLALEMATTAAARAVGLDDYGIAVGHPATFVVLDAANAAAAVAAPPAERVVVLRGEIVRPPVSALAQRLSLA
jgi:cytosine deaminase